MELTARQIKCMDEFSADRCANDRTLEVALQFHSNTVNEAIKTEHEFWEELYELHDLDRSKKYTIKKIDGAMTVVVADDE